MTRRHWLVLGVAGLIATGASRVNAASGPVQADAEVYAGSSVGEWACGPTARANYGGGGGHVRVYTDDAIPKDPPAPPPEPKHEPIAMPPVPKAEADPNDPNAPAAAPAAPELSSEALEQDRVRSRATATAAAAAEERRDVESTPDLEPRGPSIGGGGGLEHREFVRLSCNRERCNAQDVVPRGQVLFAGRASFGWDWSYFGFRAGALGYQRWSSNTDASPTSYVLPDAELRFGRRAGFHGGLGFGAYSVVTTFRPGAYLSIGYADGRWAADLRGGVHVVFDAQLGGRAELTGRYAVTRGVSPGLGLGLTSAQQISPEGRLFIVFTP